MSDSKPAAKRQNGRKVLIPVGCPHAEDCAAARMHSEVMASLDQLSQSTGLLLEQVANMGERIAKVAEVREVDTQREERWLGELSSLTRDVARRSVEAVREEMAPLIRAEVTRQTGFE